jgi:hypothetical protein
LAALRELLPHIRECIATEITRALDEKLLTIEEAAKVTGDTPAALRKRITRGRLPVVRMVRVSAYVSAIWPCLRVTRHERQHDPAIRTYGRNRSRRGNRSQGSGARSAARSQEAREAPGRERQEPEIS